MDPCDLVFIEGLRPSKRRGIALLRMDGDPAVDAVATFKALSQDREREVRSRFDTWIEGAQHNKRWFHGFDTKDYRDCMVFKWKHRNKGQRLYGFVSNPLPRTNRGFQLCVLTNHGEKVQWETDPAELNKARDLRGDPLVCAVIKMRFPDGQQGSNQ